MAQEGQEIDRVVLEVIACSVADAIQAERGGAHRLEVISHFEAGGLTPSLELVRQIQAEVSLPLRVMLRQSEPFQVDCEEEIEQLGAIAGELNVLGVEGIVLGFLRAGEIDLELTGRLLACAPDLKATFHHAFDQSRDQLRAIAELKQLPQVDRLLTAGKGTHSRQMDNFAAYEEAAAPEIRVLAGGGLDAARIRAIYRATSIREFHVGRAARVPATIDGEVSAERVRMIIAQLN